MKIYVIPVSGGAFPVQIGIIKLLAKATKNPQTQKGLRPDLVLSSSGGNVAAYIAMMSDWNDIGISRNCNLIDSSLFGESWTPSFFPTWLVFPLTKSIFRNGQGVRNLFEYIFTPKSIQTTEIWTGAYNTVDQRATMFCNKSMKDSLIKDVGDDTFIYDSDMCNYLNGDVTEISKACYASASIPFLTPGVKIGDKVYVDGGCAYASPMIPLSPLLREAIRKRPHLENIQIHYFCSYSMGDKFIDSIYSTSIGLLIHSSLLQDRAFCQNFLHQYGKVRSIPEIYINLDVPGLRDIMKSLENKSYVAIFYPEGSPSVPITGFKGSDIIKIVDNMEGKISMYVWVMEYRY